MTFSVPVQVSQAVSNHPYPLIFATVSGAHLYGFASPDSDWDLRGVHLLPADEVLGLFDPQETIEQEQKEDGVELDLVTHDARKFFALLLKRNGYVLEQLYSPLVVHTSLIIIWGSRPLNGSCLRKSNPDGSSLCCTRIGCCLRVSIW